MEVYLVNPVFQHQQLLFIMSSFTLKVVFECFWAKFLQRLKSTSWLLWKDNNCTCCQLQDKSKHFISESIPTTPCKSLECSWLYTKFKNCLDVYPDSYKLNIVLLDDFCSFSEYIYLHKYIFWQHFCLFIISSFNNQQLNCLYREREMVLLHITRKEGFEALLFEQV